MTLRSSTILVIITSLAIMVFVVWVLGSLLAVLPPLFVATVERAITTEVSAAEMGQGARGLNIGKLTLTGLALLAATDLTIIAYLNLNNDFVALGTVLIMLIATHYLDLDNPPIMALAVIPLVFLHRTDLRISYMVIIGVILSQAIPPAMKWIIDRVLTRSRMNELLMCNTSHASNSSFGATREI
jgi:hypothetical protein